MKKILFVIVLFSSLPAFSQHLEFSMSSGSGMAYIFENLDKSVNIKYGVPISLTSAFKYTPGDSRWGLKMRLQFIEASIKGTNWSTASYSDIDGFVYS